MKVVLIQDFENWKTGYVIELADGICETLISQGSAFRAHDETPVIKMKPGQYQDWLKAYNEEQAKVKQDETLSIQSTIQERADTIQSGRGYRNQRQRRGKINR